MTKTITLKESLEKISVLERAIETLETDYHLRLKNINKRLGDLEEKESSLIKRCKVLDRRLSLADADILALNGTIVTLGGSHFGGTKMQFRLPLSSSGTVTHSEVFETGENDDADIPDIEVTGFDLDKGDKRCDIKI